MYNSLWPHRLYSPRNSPGQNTGVSSRSLLQGIFLTLGSNPGLPHYRWILCPANRFIGTIFLDSIYTCSVQFSSVTWSCPTLHDPMNSSTPGLPVHHQLPESTQIHVHCVGDAIQPSHPLSSPSPPALNLSQHQGLFKWVNIPYLSVSF